MRSRLHTNLQARYQRRSYPLRVLCCLLGFSLISIANNCYAAGATHKYSKDRLSFEYPASWKVDEDLQYPGTRRSISVETPKTSLITIEIYAKDILTSFPEYRQYNSSLKQFAKRYYGRDITAKLQTNHPAREEFIKRQGMDGLKATKQFQIGDLVNKTMISEFYRVDTKDEIVFITMTAPKDEYKATVAGLDTILKSFKYH